jgi:hypothetical protein
VSGSPPRSADTRGSCCPGARRKAGERGRQQRRFLFAELSRRLAEVRGRGGASAVDAGTELDHVQVELEDPAFVERVLDLPGQDGLFELAERVAVRREPQVLDQLLGDGRGAARPLRVLQRLPDRAADLAPVEAAVGEEVDVLRDQDGALEVRRDGGVGGPADRDRPCASSRALALLVALDEGRGRGRARRERLHVRPGHGLPAEPPGEREGAQEQEAAPEPPREGPARHRQRGLTPARCRWARAW